MWIGSTVSRPRGLTRRRTMALRRGGGNGGSNGVSGRRILIIVGHPNPNPSRFCRALADAYADGAERFGHSVRRIDIATLEFPCFEPWRSSARLGSRGPEALSRGDRLVRTYRAGVSPLARNYAGNAEGVAGTGAAAGTAFAYPGRQVASPVLGGRSARIVVKMGMPGMVYRLWFATTGWRECAATS